MGIPVCIKIRQPANFQTYISKVMIIATATNNYKDLYGENNKLLFGWHELNYSCQPVMVEWISIQIFVNFEMFKLSL